MSQAENQAAVARRALEKSLEMLDGQDPYEAARTRVCLSRTFVLDGETARGQAL